MKIRSAGRPQLTLESVAMTDIIMNMFVFFFISFSLLYTFNPQRESKIKVNLPKGVTDVKSRGEKPLVVTVTGKNEIYIGSTKVSSLALSESLKSAAPTAKQHGVIVKADRQAAVDYFVKVLDAAKQAGIDKVGVSIELQPRQ
ncbi:MAG TPA: biopolymer transporter ExbD [Spirochaetota bacterium]|nr:biopolymer transporter ExbD [Spirochaetota bacterium]HNT11766.1 biopolymer transporter ExbD [Spirochaetota bacterium]HNV47914.1 biopolymer transporter ExbD [Spirochaetota bacterium]HOS40529.1 biopolymer transporter ExbD [Spirochaetota bacterium]HPI23682.1 biopolymer transporter ExbD [Spirochaetota bacterium]